MEGAEDKEEGALKVTEVRLQKNEGDDRLLAYGSITLDGEYVVNGIRVVMSNDGHPFVAYPSRQGKDGQYHDICFPLKRTLREDITMQVLSKYEAL